MSVCTIDLTVGPADPIALNITSTPIELTAGATPVELSVAASPIELDLSATVLKLDLGGTVQGPPGHDGAGAEQFGNYVAGEAITSSSLLHISEIDGLIYLADFELDRRANCFTISGFAEGESLSVLRSGLLNGLAGIVAGRSYWLGNRGQVRTSVPDHGVTQRCGDGASATEIIVSISEDVIWG